jgi:hypothetical protein
MRNEEQRNEEVNTAARYKPQANTVTLAKPAFAKASANKATTNNKQKTTNRYIDFNK